MTEEGTVRKAEPFSASGAVFGLQTPVVAGTRVTFVASGIEASPGRRLRTCVLVALSKHLLEQMTT